MKPIEWRGGALRLLDQRRLPVEIVYVECSTDEDVGDAIRTMVVRGAPAIGVCAAFGMALAASGAQKAGHHVLRAVREAGERLRQARPTAINLGWAINRMLRLMQGSEEGALVEILEREAIRIFDEDLAANRRIGAYGNELLKQKITVLTHCNAGALATSGYGTALGVVRAARDSGKKISVFANETRP
ncbi:MAG TPA: S-methyl-5-thioribose-1-phosphate isomerase, partial [Thermoanaerobaculia bacterium]|nr:S-methyl-5-thioribose-1-phosphate isomerase [Thermoanaerobaculia bacterium]